MLLNFQTLPCACGGTRILGAACPDCGRTPRSGEVNRWVVHRRSGLTRVDALLGVEPDTAGQSADDWRPTLKSSPTRLVDELLAALIAALSDFSTAPTSEPAVNALADSIRTVRTARHHALLAARLRPGTGTWTATAESMTRIDRVWDAYRDALTADTMFDAQQHARRAQGILDTVRGPLTEMAELEAFVGVLNDDSLSIPERMFAALSARYPHVTLPQLPAYGISATERDLNIAVGTNSGMSYLLLQPIARATLNPDVFRSKILHASDALTRTSRLREIAGMDDAVQALADTYRLMVEAAIAFTAILAVENDERAIARRFGKLASEIYEASAPVLAWYRLMTTDRTGSDTFNRVAAEDATKLAADLQKGPLAAVFDDAARYLRHAPVHGRALEFDPDTGVFMITLKSHREVVARADFIDRVYAFMETVFASTWALGNAIDVAGIDVTLSDSDALYMGFTPLVLTALALPAAGDLTVVDHCEVDDGWTFHIDARVDLLTPALVAAGNAVGQVGEIRLLGTTTESILTVHLTDFWAWQRAEGHALQMNVLAFKASAERDGRSMLERSDVQFMLAVFGIALMEGDVRTIMHLRRLRTWARERGWADESTLADQIIATLRGSTPAELTARLVHLARTSAQPRLPSTRAVRVLVPIDMRATSLRVIKFRDQTVAFVTSPL